VWEFVRAVDRINRLAAQAPGFVWLHENEHEDHFNQVGDDPLTFFNLSVWESYERLHAYVYRSAHAGFVRRRYEWFERVEGPATALWWVPAGHEPSPDEALARLRHLRTYGPSPRAFTVRRRFTPDGRRTGGPARR
jgi:uncharacterized protein DUF3291